MFLPKNINHICKEAAVLEKLYQKLSVKKRSTRDRDIRIKLELILLALKLGNVTEACARRGFPRKFYYKWFNRLKKAKWDLRGLQERSRRPWHSPNQTKPEIEKAVHWYRERQYGSRMIEAMLLRENIDLSKSTICHIFNKRRKPQKKPKSRIKGHNKRYELVIPGQRVQLDVKYVPEFVGGQRLYNYVAIDECTRWRVARAYPSLNEHSTLDFLDYLKANMPFPINTIQTDNGFEFTYRLVPNATADSIEAHRMNQWCKSQGIFHRMIKPGAKELNGKVERSHRIDEQYFYWKAPTDTIANFNRDLSFWMLFYNTQRLHGGLGFITPREKLNERRVSLSTGLGAALGQSQGFFSQPDLEKMRVKFMQDASKRVQALVIWQQNHGLPQKNLSVCAPSLKKIKRAA